MHCPYDVNCDYTTKDPEGDGVFHLVIVHKLTVIGAKLYQWESARDLVASQGPAKKE